MRREVRDAECGGRGGEEGEADVDRGGAHGVACDDVAREEGREVGGRHARGGGAGGVGVLRADAGGRCAVRRG